MKKCLVCHQCVTSFMSLGRQPIANRFLTQKDFLQEYFFELRAAFCEQCTMVQLLEQPDPQDMFHENYAFFSGTSRHMEIHFEKFAGDIENCYLTGKDPFVVEIGSNDGIMMRHFLAKKIRHLGIEPSANVAEVSRKRGVNTICQFFDEELAREVVRMNGQADAFLAANVMCHIPSIHSVIKGIKCLLKPKGVIVFEDPYLVDVIKKTSYDQLYDEHRFLFSGMSVQTLFALHGFELIDMIPQPTHGGSMRYILGHEGQHRPSFQVAELIANETRMGLDKIETYERFQINCETSRINLISLLTKLKADGKRVVGYAATSKSATVLNYCKLGPDLIEYIVDSTPLKQGTFSPGMHIPIVPPETFRGNYPDYAVLFGWNHQAEIFAKEAEFSNRGKSWIVFVPRLEIMP